MNELRAKKLIFVDEDNLLQTSEELTKLRKGTKLNLQSYDAMQFEYIFKAKVVDDDELNESNLPTGS
jgi:hypothetical protein